MKLKWFQLAAKLAKLSDHHTHKHGAVLVYKNRVVSLGFNQMKSHSKSSHPFKSVHAEDSAIRTANKINKGSVLYVYRENKKGILAESRPCQHCLKMLRSIGITQIYYSINNGYKSEII